MSKILVTGATGKLGKGIIKHLLKKGVLPNNITALVRSEISGERLKEFGINLCIGSYEDLDSLTEAFKGIDKLMFISSPDFDNTLRISQHANVVLAARNAKVGHIVYTGIAFAESMDVADLQYVHLATENMIKTTNIPYTFLRNGFYLENLLENILSSALAQGKLVTAAGEGRFNFVFRDDLSLCAAVVLTEENHINKSYELANSTTASFDELAVIISCVYEKKVKHVSLSPELALTQIISGGEIEPIAAFNVYGLYLPIAQGQFDKTSNDLENLIHDKCTPVLDAVKILKEK